MMGYCVKTKKSTISIDSKFTKNIIEKINDPSIFVKMMAEDYGMPNFIKTFDINAYEKNKGIENQSFEHILNDLSIEFEEKNNKFNLKINGKYKNEHRIFFRAIAFCVPAGKYITLRGEDGAIFGYFYDGIGCKIYESYGELKKLLKPYELKKQLIKKIEKISPIEKVEKTKKI